MKKGATFIRRVFPHADAEVSGIYKDGTFGDGTTASISGGSEKSNYIFDVKVADSPTYGDAEIFDLSFNAYFSSINNATISHPSKLSFFKLAKELTGNGEGGFTKGTSDIAVFTSRDESGEHWRVESFEGEFSERIINELRVGEFQESIIIKTDPYILFDDAINAAYGGTLSDMKMEERYASTINNSSVKVIKVRESKNWPGTWTPTRGRPWWNDPNWLGEGDERSWYHAFPIGHETTKNGVKGAKAGGNVKIHYSVSNTVPDRGTNILADALHPENSIFSIVRNTNPVYDEDHTEGHPKYKAYAMTSRSKENTLSGSKAAKMQCLWRTGISATLGMGNYYGGKEPSSTTNSGDTYKQPVGRQETMFTLTDLPAPIDLTAGDTVTYGRLNNDSAVEFDINFAKLEKAYTYNQTTDSSSDSSANTDAYYASLRRAFIYTQGDIAPQTDESLYDYLSLNYCYNWRVTAQALTGSPKTTRITCNTDGPCGSMSSGDQRINVGDTVYFDFCNTAHLDENGVLEAGRTGANGTYNRGGGYIVDSLDGNELNVTVNNQGDDPNVPASNAGVGTIYKFAPKNFYGCAFINLDGTGMADITGEGVRVVPFRGKDEIEQLFTATCNWNSGSASVVVETANTNIKVGYRPVSPGVAAWPAESEIIAIAESGGSGTGVTGFTLDNDTTRASDGGEVVKFNVHNVGHMLRTWYPNAAARDFVCRMDSNAPTVNSNQSGSSASHSNAVFVDGAWYTVGFHFNPHAGWCLMDARHTKSEENLDEWPSVFSPHAMGEDFMPNMKALSTGAGHGVQASSTIANGLEESDWPSASTFWLTNVDWQNQTSMDDFGESTIGSLLITGEDMEISATRDTRSDVFINQIRYRGFNWSHENATVCEPNMRKRSKVQIKGGQTRLQFNDEVSNKTLYSINNYNAWALGFTTITDIQSAKRWLLLNDFYCPDLENAGTYSDTNWDIMFTSEENFGKQVPPTQGGVSQLAIDSGTDGIAGGHEITSDGDYMCNGLTSKGWLEFDWDDATSHTDNDDFIRRENVFASARVIGRTLKKGPSEEVVSIQISPNDENIFNLKVDETYIIYLYNEEWRTPTGDTHLQSSTAVAINNIQIRSIDNGANGTFIELSKDVSDIVTTDNLAKGNILISPYRFWLTFYFDPGNNPNVSWSTVGPIATADPTTAAFAGATYNEFLYNDATVDSVASAYSNRWDLDIEGELTTIQKDIDYGYGVYEAGEGKGGYVNQFVPVIGYNDINLKGVLDVAEDLLAGETLSFMIQQTDDSSESRSTLRTRNYSATASDPFLSTIFIDELPNPIQKFKVIPNEENPFFPEITWTVDDADLWYGFLSFSDGSIINQYNGAVIHYPLNEVGTHNTTISAPTEGITGLATTVVGANGTYHVEGLAGNAVHFAGFDGGGSYIRSGTNDAADWAAITSEMSINLHFIPNSTDHANPHSLVFQTNWVDIRINASYQVEYLVYSAADRYVKCVSSSTVPRDDETPVNIIATFDASLDTANLKLYYNGVLEDQSGAVVSAHNSDAEFTGWIQNTNRASNSNYFLIGGNLTTNGGYSGRIEEVVVYSKCIYPVVPENGKYILTKPLAELKDGFDVAESKSNTARLFIKDFHNIRGGLTNQVRASENISWRKASFTLDTS